MQNTKPSHICKFCGRNYQRKTYYDRHKLTCEFLSKSSRERELELEERDATPSHRKLYELVLELTIRNAKLEEKVAELGKVVSTQRKKICVIDWLNTNCHPTQTFEGWRKKVSVERKHMEGIFKYDYVQGMQYIFEESLPIGSENELPIRAFDQKENALFIYDGEVWKTMTPGDFEKLTAMISKKVMGYFIELSLIHISEPTRPY